MMMMMVVMVMMMLTMIMRTAPWLMLTGRCGCRSGPWCGGAGRLLPSERGGRRLLLHDKEANNHLSYKNNANQEILMRARKGWGME